MKKRRAKMSVVSLVLGGAGLVFLLLPFIFQMILPFIPVSVICGLLAVIFGLNSYFGKGEDSYSLLGIALGGVALSLGLLWIIGALLIALGT